MAGTTHGDRIRELERITAGVQTELASTLRAVESDTGQLSELEKTFVEFRVTVEKQLGDLRLSFDKELGNLRRESEREIVVLRAKCEQDLATQKLNAHSELERETGILRSEINILKEKVSTTEASLKSIYHRFWAFFLVLIPIIIGYFLK